jgi:hypothetical protein
VWERVSSVLRENRRRIAAVVLVVFVLVVGLDLAHTVPRETHLALDLGEGHDLVRSFELSYTCGDESVEQARHRTPDGAPARVSDSLDLVPGHYEVRLDLVYADGHIRTREGQFDVPAEGVVVVQWTH